MRLQDRITATKIRDGDVKAFETFINQYQDKVFNYCLRLSNNFQIAEELTQEAFIKVYQNINSYDSKKAALSTWLFRIAHNLSLNYLRDNVQPNLEMNWDIAAYSPSPEDQYLITEKYEKLLAALHELPLEGQEMILLKDYLGFSCQELTAIFDIPAGTVKSRLHKLRKRLRELVGDDYDE